MKPVRPSFLDSGSLRLLLFGGKGGVGKTTCATAAALRLAASRAGDSFLLLSTDPAHSLRDSMAGTAPPANLRVLELDASECLNAFRAAHGQTLHEIAVAGTFLDDGDIDRFLKLSLPGLDELMAFLQISDWVESGEYACIVVDTAPSGHTLRLLEMPALLRKWLSMLNALLAKRRYMKKVFSRSSRADHLDRFVANWSEAIDRMSALLNDPARCEFVPITIPEPLGVRETMVVLRELERFGIATPNLIVNQLHSPGPCPACSEAYAFEREQIRELLCAERPVWTIELLADEVRGVERLQRFWDRARPLEDAPPAVWPMLQVPREHAVDSVPLPPPETRLILFAGKGGVGKTTLACATAARLTHEFPDKRILLVSTDPAHSLSACLEVEIGAHPTPVLGGLSAMEIDGAAQFEALKAGYAEDIGRFLQSLSARFDLTFDRVVFEKLMDLAPPGLDEVMALASILDLLSERQFDLFVLDSAPTGHFLRLMQLPSLVHEWLKTFFHVLLKYAGYIELPGFASRLVALSQNLKKFRGLVSDPSRAMLCAVAIPTEMAFEETRDLLAACDALGIVARTIFLNRMTPRGECRLCDALRRRELQVADRFRRAFPSPHQVLVYRQAQPAGLERLEELAGSLFQESREPERRELAGTYAAD